MDPTTMATGALAALLPYLAKGGEELAKSAGKDLWELVKKPFTKDREKTLVKKLETDPTDEATRGAVTFKLAEFLEEDAQFAKQLEIVMKAHPELVAKNNKQIIAGDGNVAIQDITASVVKVNK